MLHLVTTQSFDFANSISSLAVQDPSIAVEVLGLIQDILPSVAALNNLAADDSGGRGVGGGQPTDPPTQQHYAWAESDHPYKPATVSNYTVKFPPSVDWLSLEFDPRYVCK